MMKMIIKIILLDQRLDKSTSLLINLQKYQTRKLEIAFNFFQYLINVHR